MLVPFNVHFSTAIQGQTRPERLLYGQKMAVYLYTQIAAIPGITLSKPGSGQATLTNFYTFSDTNSGMKFKPQFGNQPPKLSINGFYNSGSSDINKSQFFNWSRFLNSSSLGGPINGPDANAVGVPTNSAAVRTFKTAIDNAVAIVNSQHGYNIKTLKLEYQGLIYGDAGIHFPV